MDSSDDSDDRNHFLYTELTRYHIPYFSVSGIHKAVVEGDLSKVIRCIKSGESVNKRGTLYKVSLLHVAVIFNKLEILDYLLAEEDVEVDARCAVGRTPLHVATLFGHIECVLKLIQAGCDINATDDLGKTALHQSAYPSVTPLHQKPQVGRWSSILSRRLDILHILLYYNADANIPDDNDEVPFFIALLLDNEEAQKVLFDYVDDFNRIVCDGMGFFSMLGFALEMKSPFVKDIIERGADVNCEFDEIYLRDSYHCVFSMCLCHPLDSSIFKMVWERLRYNGVKIPERDLYDHEEYCSLERYEGVKYTIDLLNFLNYDDAVPTFLPVIIESDNFETAVQIFCKEEHYFLFVNKFARKKFDFDQLTALTCRLLEHGFRASSYDINEIFFHYGDCELFRILLYMDNDYSRGWLPHMAFTRLMCDIDYNLKSIADEVNVIPKETVLQLLEFSVHPHLINALSVHYSEDERMSAILGRLPRVPSLIDLARDPARKQIWQSFKITNTCQFYTTIDHLDIPTVCKNILTFRRKLYVVK